MELAYSELIGHFEPVYLLQVVKMMMKNIASQSNLALPKNFVCMKLIFDALMGPV